MGKDSSTSSYTQKQCINCRKFYTEIENNSTSDAKPICIYHKGKKSSLKHKEDLGYTALISKFPVQPGAIEVIKQAHNTFGGTGVPEDDEILIVEKEKEKEKIEPVDDTYVIHNVELTDTLVGISLYYQVKIEDIQKANNLKTQQIYHHKTLIIPNSNYKAKIPTGESEANIKLRREQSLMREVSCSREEAKYYLESCDYNLQEAIQEWKNDSEWEEHNNPKDKPKPKKVVHRYDKYEREKTRICC